MWPFSFAWNLLNVLGPGFENPRVRGSIPRLATRIFKGLTVRSGPCRLAGVTET